MLLLFQFNGRFSVQSGVAADQFYRPFPACVKDEGETVWRSSRNIVFQLTMGGVICVWRI